MLKLFFFFLVFFAVFLVFSQGETQERRGNVAQNGDTPPGALGSVVEWESPSGNSNDLAGILDVNDNTFIRAPISAQGFRTKYLMVQDFRFDIPQDARIDRIILQIKRSKDGGADAEDRALYLTYRNILSDDKKDGSEFQTNIQTITYNNTPGEWGFSNIQASDIMDPSFGLQYTVDGGICICSGHFFLHDVKITVEYTPTSNNETTTSTGNTVEPTERPTTSTEPDNKKDDNNNDSNVVGAVLGVIFGIVGLCALMLLFFFLYRRRTQKQNGNIENATKADSTYSSIPTVHLAEYTTSSQKSDKLSSRRMDLDVKFEDLLLDKELGRGAYGVVFLGKWRLQEVAIKKLQYSDLSDKQIQEFMQEAELMKSIRPHKNVLILLGVCLSPLCIVTEYLANGSLVDYFSKNQINSSLLLKWAKGIASGMTHLHEEGIVHRDLAARNILLSESLEAKISDFGLARILSLENDENKTSSVVGPLKWMSPESLESQTYSRASDVWSYGIVIVEILLRGIPYPNEKPYQVAAEVVTKKKVHSIPEHCHPDLAEILQKCWKFEPEERPSFLEIYEALGEIVIEEKKEW